MGMTIEIKEKKKGKKKLNDCNLHYILLYKLSIEASSYNIATHVVMFKHLSSFHLLSSVVKEIQRRDKCDKFFKLSPMHNVGCLYFYV